MWPIIINLMRGYAPYLVLPFAGVIGFVGYHVEGVLRGDKETPWRKSIAEERNDRLLEEIDAKGATNVESLYARQYNQTFFDKNKPKSQ